MMKITMGKCWQSGYGAIVFQCSTHDGTTRQKGYLELNPAKNDSPVAFTLDKPAGDLAPKGVATLIRKYLDTGSLTAMALSPWRRWRVYSPDISWQDLRGRPF